MNARELTKKYAEPNDARSWFELLVTLGGGSAVFLGIYVSFTQGWWFFYGILILVLSLFMMKFFVLFHDCTHGSMFKKDFFNKWVGRCLSLVLTVPFMQWKLEHEEHHSHVVDIERRNAGDILLYTVEQYKQAPWYKKIAYKIYRSPIFLLMAAPFLYFIVKTRFPSKSEKSYVLSVLLTNLSLLVVYSFLAYKIGLVTLIAVFLPGAYLGGVIGICLFYLQHDYPNVRWFITEDWEFEKASLEGSSLIKLPQPIEWFSHAIGYHHIHHMNSKIPGYRLKECYLAHSVFQEKKALTWVDVRAAFQLKLWSQSENRLVKLSEL